MNMQNDTHNLYLRCMSEYHALLETLSAMDHEAGEAFSWEISEAIGLIRKAKRYMEKPGEVLFCNWRGCIHADSSIECAPNWPIDYRGRAIPIGEGEPWFKGRVHTECWEAIQKERTN